MSSNSLLRRIFSINSSHKQLTILAVISLLVAVALWTTGSSRAASPASGTLNPVNGTSVSWDGTAVGGASDGEGTCIEGVNCDTYTLNVAPGDWSNKLIYIRITWDVPTNDYDLYVHKNSNAGPTVGSSGNGPPNTSEQVSIQPAIQGTGVYTVHVVYFAATGPADQYHGTATVLATSPRPALVDPGAPGLYTIYPAPNGLGTSAGEPSIGVNFNSEVAGVSDGGTAMFIAILETLRVRFSNTTTPATATWTDVSAPTTSIASLDPILFTDRQTGRTIVSQLTGQDSLSAFTDNDGALWIPGQGGGIPSGVDHQTMGGGPYNLTALPVPIPHPFYPNAVYYCSQDVVTAFCARSDNGGASFGAGIPTWTGVECNGLHGHVKVAPNDGTVYVPNKGCGTNQGVAVSEDNGITWTVRKVIDNNFGTIDGDSSPGDWDSSIGIGANGTAYFGYKNGDGTAHMAVSRDHGKTWVRDYDVGAAFNVKDIAFPAVVAGDDDRAALAFLGTTGEGGPESQVWHLYVAHTYDRGASYTTTDLTPTDPVQIGTICSGGISCGDDRNLLDFMDVTIDKQGRVLVGYADGCLAGCTSAATSRSALGTIARQCSGRGLLAAFGPFSSCGSGPPPTPTPTPTPDPTPTPTPAPCGSPTEYSNLNSIATNDGGAGSPYPSFINVAGLTGTVTKVTVELNGLDHTFPDDVDIMLVGPGGQNARIMSDVGGNVPAIGVTLTLDDAGLLALPDNGPLVSGSFQPTNVGAVDTFPPPAPASSPASALSLFNGTNPNGTWRLYVVDDTTLDSGQFTGGWALNITTNCTGTLNNSSSSTTGTFATLMRNIAITWENGDDPLVALARGASAPGNTSAALSPRPGSLVRVLGPAWSRSGGHFAVAFSGAFVLTGYDRRSPNVSGKT